MKWQHLNRVVLILLWTVGIIFVIRGTIVSDSGRSRVLCFLGLSINKSINIKKQEGALDALWYTLSGTVIIALAGYKTHMLRRSRPKKVQQKKPALPAPDTLHALTARLKDFEKSELLNDPELSLQTLAKQLSTNPKALSIVIKNLYQKDYRTYISDLRITRLLDMLRMDPRMRNYRLSDLGATVGFSNVKTFKTAFHNKMGITITKWLQNHPADQPPVLV